MFYPKIGDYALLRNGKVAKIAQENVVFSIEVLPDLRPATCSKEFIVKTLPPVNLDNLKIGDKVRLASGKIWKINGMDCPTDRSWFLVRFSPQDAGVNYCRYNRQGGNITISASDQSFNIVEIIPQVDLHTLKAGDTVELANGETEKVKSIACGSPQSPFQVYFADDGYGWFYSASGNCAGVESRRIVKIIPFITPFTTVRGTGTALRTDRPRHSAATVRSKPKLNLYTLEPGAVVTLANGNTKEVLEVDLQSRAHENHICITFADGVWIYNPDGTRPDGTRPPGRDRTCNIVGVIKITPKPKPTPLTIGGHIVKPGDALTRANGDQIVVDKEITWDKARGGWKVWHSAHGGCFFEVDSSGRCHDSPGLTITAVAPNLTTPQVQPGTRMTLERLTQLVEQNPSALAEIARLAGQSVTDLLSDLEKGLSVPWPKPITTPPAKKDADPLGQVAVLDKDTDWMKQQWWYACDMLDAGEITGWAHTQAWHDAKNKPSDPWS